MKYTDHFLPGPFPLERYKKNLPYFLSEIEKETHQKNLKTKPSNWKYRTKEIQYTLNSVYYRTAEWNNIDWKNSIVVFGCSHVFGEGLADDETLCHFLQKITGKYVVNMGVPGTGPTFSWYNNLILDKLYPTPYAVVNIWSSYERVIYFSDTQVKRIGPWSGTIWDEYDKHANNLFLQYNNDEINAASHFYFTALVAMNYWRSKTKYAHASFFENVADVPLDIPLLESSDLARDDIHYGEKTQYNAALKISELIK
jgi:hypothetical protein